VLVCTIVLPDSSRPARGFSYYTTETSNDNLELWIS
jgi:hypothetical protein